MTKPVSLFIFILLDICFFYFLISANAQTHNRDKAIIKKLEVWDDSLMLFKQDRLKQLYEDCGAIAQSIEEPLHDSTRAFAFNLQGNAAYNMGNTADALRLYKRVLQLRENAFGRFSDPVANALRNIGLVYAKKNRPSEAGRYYKEAYNIKQSLFLNNKIDEKELVDINITLGNNFFKSQKIDSARFYLEKALRISEKLSMTSNQTDYPFLLNELGNAQIERQKAIFYYKKTLDIPDLEQSFITQVNINIGNAYREMGKYDTAKTYIGQAIQFYRQNLNKANTADFSTAISSQADCLREIGSYNEARKVLGEAYAYTDPKSRIDWFSDLGKILRRLNQLGAADTAFWTAHDLANHFPDPTVRKQMLGNINLYLGRIAYEQASNDRAIIRVKAAMQLATDTLTLANAILLLGKIYAQTQQQSLAYSAFQKARTLAQKSKEWRIVAAISFQETEAYISNKDFSKALQALNDGKNALQQATETPSVSNEFLYEKTQAATLETAIAYQMALKSPKNADWKRVQAVADTAIELLRTTRLQIGERQAEVQLQTDFEANFDVAVEAAWQLGETEKAFFISEQAKQNILKQLVFKALPNKELPPKEAYSSKELSAGLNEGQTLSSFYWSNQRLLGFILLKNKPLMSYEIQMTDSLATDIKEFYEACSNRPDDIPDRDRDGQLAKTIALSKKIFSRLYPPNIAPQLGAELIIVPHRWLCFLPFDALIQPDNKTSALMAEQNFILKDHDISYTYSATLWHAAKNISLEEASMNVLAVAPNFTMLSDEQRDTLSIYQYFEPLDNNESEVQAILEKMKGKSLLGTEATSQTFKTELPNYDIIHLATHGAYDDQNPESSVIAFAGGELLRGEAIYNLTKLRTNMVVLSACQTAIGSLRGGEGMMSLAHGFQYAGARTVVASLWNVVDATSPDFMRVFYGNLASGTTKTKALSEAKRYLLKKGNYEHPYFWSSLMLIGDERSLQAQKTSIGWWCLGLLIVVGTWFVWRKKMITK